MSFLEGVDVRRPGRVADLLARAMRQRAVGATATNEHSSRSHMVFTLAITGTNAASGQEVRGGFIPKQSYLFRWVPCQVPVIVLSCQCCPLSVVLSGLPPLSKYQQLCCHACADCWDSTSLSELIQCGACFHVCCICVCVCVL